MPRQSHELTRRKWTERITRFDASNLTIAQFCVAEGCSQASFYQWRRRLRAESSPNEDSAKRTLATFVPVELPDTSHTQDTTAGDHRSPARSTPLATTTAVLSVELPGGIRVRIETSAGDDTNDSNTTDTQVTA